jgi:hypothetical protein
MNFNNSQVGKILWELIHPVDWIVWGKIWRLLENKVYY